MKISIIIIAALILGVITYITSVIIRVYIKVKEFQYKEFINHIKIILLNIEDAMLNCKSDPDHNLVLLEIGYDDNPNGKRLKDKILILFSTRPKVDKDGEVFIVVGEFDIEDIDNDNRRLKLVSKSIPLFVSDTKDYFEYYKYTRKNCKRIKNILLYITKYRNITVNWASDTLSNRIRCRSEIIDIIKRRR